MDIVDIYGQIFDKSEIIIAVGNYNSIHGVASYNPSNNLLQISSLSDVDSDLVLELIINHESLKPTNRLYFSLIVKDTNNFINVNISNNVATACIGSNKAIFWVDYSSIDHIPRPQLFSGVLYCLYTIVNNKAYPVTWTIDGFPNGDLVIFLPTTWYEFQNSCQIFTGTRTLIENLNQLKFKGYTNLEWCENMASVTHCVNESCGDCLGNCDSETENCYYSHINNKFVCLPHQSQSDHLQPDHLQSDHLQSDHLEPSNAGTGTVATLIAITIVIIIVALIAWGIARYDEK